MSSRGLVHIDQRNDSDAFLDLQVLEKMRPTLQKIATPSEYSFYGLVPTLLILLCVKSAVFFKSALSSVQ